MKLPNGQAKTYLSLPLASVKDKLMSYTKGVDSLLIDLRELPEVNLVAVYQLMLAGLGDKEFGSQPAILFAMLKKRLKNRDLTVMLCNLQIIYPYYESFFTNLESLAEECPQLKFIFHFTHNILTERIVRQLGGITLPYKDVGYLPIDGLYVITPDRLLAQMNDNEQVILREIVRHRFMFRSELKADVDYLTNTGLIRNYRGSWTICWQPLVDYFCQESGGGELEIIGDSLYLDGEEINGKLSLSQQRLLVGLAQNKTGIVKREQLAKILWGESWTEVSEWALDKAVNRLRRKLVELTGQNLVETKKGRGVVFCLPSQVATKSIDFKALVFKPLVLSQEILDFHYTMFNNPEDNQYLFTATPKNKGEIASWLKSCLANPNYTFWSIYYRGRLVGDCSLKYTDKVNKTASLGDAITPYSLWGSIGEKIFSFIIIEAKKQGLKTLYHHPNANNLLEREALIKVGFTTLLGQEAKLVLNL